MRRALAILALLCLPGCDRRAIPARDAVPPAETLTFGHAPMVAGAKWTRREEMETSVGGTLVGIDRSEQQMEALAVDSGVPSKIRVTYARHAHTSANSGERVERPTPLEGKTYIVAHAGAEVLVTGASGEPVPDEEATIVRHDHARVGSPDPMAAAIPETPIRVGESIDAMGKALRTTNEAEGSKVTLVTVRLLGIRDAGGLRAGAFEYRVDAERAHESSTARTVIRGTQVFRASDRAEVEDEAEGETTSGASTVTFRFHATTR